MAAEETTYRSLDVCRLAGCSYRSFDYWCRQGLFGEVGFATGSGSRRDRFTGGDVKLARALVRISDAGLLGGGSRGPSTVARFAEPIRRDIDAGQQSAVVDIGSNVTVIVSLRSADGSEP